MTAYAGYEPSRDAASQIQGAALLGRGWRVVRAFPAATILALLLALLVTLAIIAGLAFGAQLLFPTTVAQFISDSQNTAMLMGLATAGGMTPAASAEVNELLNAFLAKWSTEIALFQLLGWLLVFPLFAGLAVMMLRIGRGYATSPVFALAGYARMGDILLGTLIVTAIGSGPGIALFVSGIHGYEFPAMIWSWIVWIWVAPWVLLVMDQNKSAPQALRIALRVTSGARMLHLVALVLLLLVGMGVVLLLAVLQSLLMATLQPEAAVLVLAGIMLSGMGVMIALFQGIQAAYYDLLLRAHARNRTAWYDASVYQHAGIGEPSRPDSAPMSPVPASPVPIVSDREVAGGAPAGSRPVPDAKPVDDDDEAKADRS